MLYYLLLFYFYIFGDTLIAIEVLTQSSFQEGHNIFAKLTSGEYKYVLSHLKHCILATDLALFFPNRERLNMLVAEDNFSWNMPEHRLLVQALCMTGSDLSASAKPWDIQAETVKVIFEEFYQQGRIKKF